MDEMFNIIDKTFEPRAANVYCDNMATLGLIKNRVHHSRTKHIQLRNNFVRERQDAGEIIVSHVNTADNLADMFTKPVSRQIIEQHAPYVHGEPMKYSQ